MIKNLVEIKNLTFSREERCIYNDISLSIPQGKVTAIMGPSGIGKTTLLRLMGGQLKPNSGEILFAGHKQRTSRGLVSEGWERNKVLRSQYHLWCRVHYLSHVS